MAAAAADGVYEDAVAIDAGYEDSIGRGMDFPSQQPTHSDKMQAMKAESSHSGSSIADDTVSMRSRQRPRNRRPPSPPPLRYQDEEQRVESFRGVYWPSNIPQPQQLAAAGLYFVGPPDRVKCAFCGGKLRNWVAEDLAESEHFKHFPHCTFIQSVQQKAFLSKSRRKKLKKEQYTTSDILMEEAAKDRKQKGRLSQKNLPVLTLRRMGYDKAEIHCAKRHLKNRNSGIELQQLLEELQSMERETFMGELVTEEGDCVETDGGIADSSGSEDTDTDRSNAEMLTGHGDEHVVERLDKKLRAVNREHEEMVKQVTCKVCLVARVDTLFLTCRHLVTCKDCADRVKDCPVCRKVILGTVDVFMG